MQSSKEGTNAPASIEPLAVSKPQCLTKVYWPGVPTVANGEWVVPFDEGQSVVTSRVPVGTEIVDETVDEPVGEGDVAE